VKARFFYSILIAVILIVGCGGGADGEDVVEKSSFQMPIKENTWVRKEAVRKSSHDIATSVSAKENPLVPTDPALVAKLKKPVSLSINTKEECIKQAGILDKQRTRVQEGGGVWGAYERVMDAKPYSNYGMQLDSQTNRLVFSLKHICRNSKEVQLDGWGTKMVKRFKKMGKEGFKDHFLNLGEVPGDIDRWVQYAEFSIHSKGRDIPFSKIGESLSRAMPLLILYEELSQMKVDDANLQNFLAKGASLLSVINESFKTDPQLVTALQDEEIMPFEDLQADGA
tara:strand:- start:47 stop:895 length:849 start_codon:yes stop_codon:yes gene_type:complete